MKPIVSASLLKVALLGGVAAGAVLSGAPRAHAEVGVAAAVNVDARGRPPGAVQRVITLGSNVVFNEEITTDSLGLVQILLLDGTTFTVGPNSQLTIDEFVYNPNTGDAKVVASLTRGVFRFVGARTSQKDGGATVKTPVGTIGIRGAVTNISYDPVSGESTAALVAGNKLTITDGDGTQRIVYETGYTAVITKDPNGGTTTIVRKSTAAETRVFQQQLAGKPGQSGGTDNPPDDETVEQSEIGETNSGFPNTMDVPGSAKPVQSSDPDQVEQVAGIDGKTQDDLDQDIEEQQQEPEPEPDAPNARVLTAPDQYEPGAYEDDPYADPGLRGLVGSTDDSDRLVRLDVEGNRLVSSDGTLDLPDFTGGQGNGPVNSEYQLESLFVCGECTYSASLDGIDLEGVAYAGRGDFVTYLLGFSNGPEPSAQQPVYVIYGTPTPQSAQNSMESGFNIREYTLTQDPIQNIPVPFFNNDLYAGGFAPGTYNSSNLFVVEPAFSETADVRGFQSWVSIEGTGAQQKSAAFVNASNIYREDGSSPLQLGSGRTGSFRYSSSDGATNMRGGIATLPGATGNHFFGPNADHFVIGTSIDPADTFFDSHHGSGFSDPEAVGYLSDGRFATHHVGSLIDVSPQGDFSRVNGGEDGRLHGFMAGMGETDYFDSTYRLTSGGGGPNMYASFNAVDNAFAARGTVYDYNGDENDEDNSEHPDHLSSMLLTFGHYTDEENVDHFGQGTYVDDTYYGARGNDDLSQTTVTTDDGNDHTDNDQYAAGSYIVSGRANPIEGYQHLDSCTDCEFIQWGWWGTRTQTQLGNDDVRTDYVHMGTWVAGEIVDPDDLPDNGGATFVGTALGTVARNDGESVAQYIAKGGAEVYYDFGSRQAEVAITDFDGMYVSGQGYDTSTDTQTLFSGNLQSTCDCQPELTGNFSGALVGQNAPAGAIGDFSFSGTNLGDSVRAVGTFATKQAF